MCSDICGRASSEEGIPFEHGALFCPVTSKSDGGRIIGREAFQDGTPLLRHPGKQMWKWRASSEPKGHPWRKLLILRYHSNQHRYLRGNFSTVYKGMLAVVNPLTKGMQRELIETCFSSTGKYSSKVHDQYKSLYSFMLNLVP